MLDLDQGCRMILLSWTVDAGSSPVFQFVAVELFGPGVDLEMHVGLSLSVTQGLIASGGQSSDQE